ncbi:MAG: hypothetical protein U0R50_12940 [Gaiellales bacterium]
MGAQDRLETSFFAFATDLADEGVDAVLDNVEHRAGVGGIMPAFVYHAARDVFPHNPNRRVSLHERGAYFFDAKPSLYAGLRIQPRLDPLVRERDVLAETCRAAAARGLAVRAWTVFLHPDRPGELADCAPRNAFGDRYEGDLCPANPDVRAYVRALVADVARYEVEAIVAESLHYHGLEHGYHHERYFVELGSRSRYLLGLCFCDHCLAEASAAGVDGPAVCAAVRDELERVFAAPPREEAGELEREDLAAIADGELSAYLDVRAATVASLAAEASEIAEARGRRFVFIELAGAVKGYATGRPTGGPAADSAWRLGVSLEELGKACRQVEVLGYAAEAERLSLDLETYAQRLEGCALAVALRPSPPDCSGPANLRAKLDAARDAAVARVDFYHYGLIRLEALDWIREALT